MNEATVLAGVGEVTIRGYLADEKPADPRVSSWVTAAQVRGALAEIQAQGARVALVHVESPGGWVRTAFAMLEALRAFQEAGGRVVVHVTDVRSSAVVLAVAGDLVVMDPAATIIVHSMIGEDRGAVVAANRAVQSVLEARTATPAAELASWLELRDGTEGPNFAELDVAAAMTHGWVDTPGSIEDARACSHVLAGGRIPRTPRAATLRAKEKTIQTRREVLAELGVLFLGARGGTENLSGAKLDHHGTALKVAAQNLQIGPLTAEQLFLGKAVMVPVSIYWSGQWFVSPGMGCTATHSVVTIPAIGVHALQINVSPPAGIIWPQFSRWGWIGDSPWIVNSGDLTRLNWRCFLYQGSAEVAANVLTANMLLLQGNDTLADVSEAFNTYCAFTGMLVGLSS